MFNYLAKCRGVQVQCSTEHLVIICDRIGEKGHQLQKMILRKIPISKLGCPGTKSIFHIGGIFGVLCTSVSSLKSLLCFLSTLQYLKDEYLNCSLARGYWYTSGGFQLNDAIAFTATKVMLYIKLWTYVSMHGVRL